VIVGKGVSVGGKGVSVGGKGVSVGGKGVSVGGKGVSVGGKGVSVATPSSCEILAWTVASAPMRAKRASTVASTSINVLADESASFPGVGTLEGLLVLPQAHASNRNREAMSTIFIIYLILHRK
jgi:hypothetical protein